MKFKTEIINNDEEEDDDDLESIGQLVINLLLYLYFIGF